MFRLSNVHCWAAFLAASFYPSLLQASPIVWKEPFNLTNVSGLSTSGTLVRAVNATTDGNSPVVMVGSESIPFQAVNLGPSGTGTDVYFTGDGGDTGDVNLNAVLNSHVWGGAAWSFTLSGLTAGKNYQIQLIGAGDTRSCCSARNQRAGDGEGVESVSADFSRSGVGSVIGTFSAGGAEQTVRVLPGLVNGTDPGLSGYILRELAPPGAQPPTDIGLSNTLIAPGSGPGLVIGKMTAVDPNAGDTHAFSLVNTAAFPDNARFTIVGDQLQAAEFIVAQGAEYLVRVRATDSGALTSEKTLTLTVQLVQAPSALSLSASTIPSTAQVGATAGSLTTVDANPTDIHVYTLVDGAGGTDNARFTVVGNQLRLAGSLPEPGSVLAIRVRTTDLAGQFLEKSFTLLIPGSSVRINEFLANNNAATRQDEDLTTPDWIEIHNPSAVAVHMAGWRLTDDPLVLSKWTFPAISIPAGGYRLVFASGKNRTPLTGNLHTNFSLDSSGGYLALVSPDGTVASGFGAAGVPYPPQRAGISYGVYGTPLQTGFMRTTTPEAANNASSGVLGFVADTKFSTDRGFYSTAFDLTITTATPDAIIRYTTNGSWPSETVGTIYSAPIPIIRSQPVKAIAYKAGHLSTDVDTHTYLFVNDVVGQTNANVRTINGLPNTWSGTAAYYGLDGNSTIVNPVTHPTLKNDLKTVPSLSISIETNDMFGSGGIYSNPNSAGAAWERKTSLELIDPATPDGSGNFQENCVIQIQGGAFRGFGLTRKKSFRITFKPDFGTANLPSGGPGRLNFPLFGPTAAQSFNTFTMRMESNDGWQWSDAGGQPQYARDQFGRRVMQELGQPASSGRYLHVYINGVYWGVYNAVERPDASFAESYLGANPALWQGQNSGQPINGATNIADWTAMLGVVDDITPAATPAAKDVEYLQSCGFNADGTRNPAYPIWIDPTNFADYLVVNWYAGNSDWPFKNYYGGRAREPNSTGFKFFMWDCEWALLLRAGITTNRTADFSGIAAPQNHLEKSPEYRLRFADRAYRALFNSGPLTPARARIIYDSITSQHRSILIPESARWGNQHGGRRGVANWQTEYNSIVNTWFPVRTGNFATQLRTRSLLPAIEPPVFSQHGGSVPAGGSITMTVAATVSKIYYQFGSGDADLTDYEHSLDPRLVGGGIHPSATLIEFADNSPRVTPPIPIPAHGWLLARSYNSTTAAWSALNIAFFTIATVPASAENLVISEMNYHPAEPPVDSLFPDRDDYEYLELKNVLTASSLDLTGVRFSEGITFDFADRTIIPPGGRLVIVRNRAAFESRYAAQMAGMAFASNKAGTSEYTGRLGNEGELLTMLTAAGAPILHFSYDDDLPWPPAADGLGFSLVLKQPSTPVPDHALPGSWVAGRTINGAPGQEDAFGFNGDPAADVDLDGYSALIEYALGSSDATPGDAAQAISVTSQGAITGPHLAISFRRNLHAQNVLKITPQISPDLGVWNSGNALEFLIETDHKDGTSTVLFRSAAPVGSTPRQFIRLLVAPQS